MMLIFSLLALVAGGGVVVWPRRTKESRKRVLRTLRLISRKRYERRITVGQLRVERCFGLLLVLLALSDLVHVRVATAAPPKEGLRPALVTDATVAGTEQQVADLGRRFMAEHRPVGLVLGVIDGGTSLALAFGEVKLGSGRKPNERTLFEIGSITKTMTATVLASLMLSGEVRGDQPIKELLPEEQRVPEFGGRRITLGHLATHTSGLPRLAPGIVLRLLIPGRMRNPYRSFSEEDMYQFLATWDLDTTPGTKLEYSNVGAGLLGLALARKTASTCDQMYRRYVCGPLGMSDTVIELTPEQKTRLAAGYETQWSLGPLRLADEAENWESQDSMAGAGAIKSSLHDMLLYLEANLETPRDRVGEACRLAQTPHFSDGRTTMGLGWTAVPLKGVGEVICHDGGTGGYSSLIAFNRRGGYGVVLLCNTSEHRISALGIDILRMIAQQKTPAKVAAAGK